MNQAARDIIAKHEALVGPIQKEAKGDHLAGDRSESNVIHLLIAPHEAPPSLRIGEYSISPFGPSGFWISHLCGEGMATSEALLEKCISDFYRTHF